jgi:hypothetical protein
MIRATCATVVLVSLAAAGCWPMDFSGARGPDKIPAQGYGSTLPLRPAPPVTPEQVTEKNAHQKLQALRQEMEEAQRDLPAGGGAEGTTSERPTR